MYFFSIKKEYNIGVELPACWTGHVPIVKTTVETLLNYFVP